MMIVQSEESAMHIFANPPEGQTKALLTACNLPIEDLDAGRIEHFLGCGDAQRPLGVVGVEIYAPVALLRSLAVAESARGSGCGKRLIAEAEAYAARRGVEEIYLLTNTAARLFESLGYAVASRESAPAAIRATREFSSLCPDSATFMVKRIAT